MRCSRCQSQLEAGESHRHAGMLLCDDCYMNALSPAKACDPWAVYTASRLPDRQLNQAQEAILTIIGQKGKAPLDELSQAAGLDRARLERELAALRHMELIGADPGPDGGKYIRRFKDHKLSG